MQTENKADNEVHRLMDATALADRGTTAEIRRTGGIRPTTKLALMFY